MSKHISLASYELEAAARAEGYAHVCGADEAGAGPLMGPVYAAAVILPEAMGLLKSAYRNRQTNPIP